MSAQPAPAPGEERLRLRATWQGVAGARRNRVLWLVALLAITLTALVYGIATSGRAPRSAVTATPDVAAGGGGEWLSKIPDTPRGRATQQPQQPAQAGAATPTAPTAPAAGTTAKKDSPPPPTPSVKAGPGPAGAAVPGAAKPLSPEEQYRLEVEKKRREALTAALVSSPIGGAGAQPQAPAGVANGRAAVPPEAMMSDWRRPVAPSDPMGGRSQGSEEDAQNKQAEKAAFLEAAENRRRAGYLGEARTAPISPYEIKAGSIIPAVMLSGINSDLPGAVVAQVRANVYDYVSAQHVLIPQGSRLVGRYDSQIAYGQERVLVVWERIVFPDGSSLMLQGMPGVDSLGQGGSTDQVDNHYGKLFGGVILSSILGVGAQAAYGPHVNTVDPSLGQLGMQGIASSVNQAGQQLTRKNLNVQPTLVIRPGYLFNVLVTRDLVLPVYAMGGPQE